MDIPLIACGAFLGIGWVLVLLPKRQRRAPSIRRWCDEAGLSGVPLGVIALVLATAAVVVGFTVSAVIPIPVMAPLGAAVGLALPIIVLAAARDGRRRRARALWPDIIDSVRVALRSGSTLVDAVAGASVLIPAEWRASWGALETDLHRGSDVDSALRRLQRSLADPIADRVIECLVVTREFGGTELPTVLAELGRSIRREQAIRDEAQSRQSWVRHAATLGVVAPWVVLAMLSSRPENRAAFASSAGTLIIVASAGATVVAYTVMSALGALRESPRWLFGGVDE